MDKKSIAEIEDFATVSSNVRLLGYDSEGKKTGFVPLAEVKGKQSIAGARWKIGESNPEGEPYGDYDMIANLNEALGLGGYLVSNDHTRQKLASDNHFKLKTGGTAALDGTMGHYQWGWGVPFYYANWKDNTYEYEAVSLQPIPGHWNYKIPVASMSCAGAAALDRTNNILVSYCNRATQFRGGNNDTTKDAAWNTLLGKPVTNIAEDKLQTCAEKNGERWAASMERMHFIVGALMRIFFHNRNIQASYNATLTADGLHQGGLGMGVDNVSSSYSNQCGTVDIDALANKGDALGVFSIEVKDGDTTKLTVKNIPVFFGLKNFYHYIWYMLHGVLYRRMSDKSADVFQQRIWGTDAIPTGSVATMEQIGNIATTGQNSGVWVWPTKMNIDRLSYIPLEYGGSERQFYCDGYVDDASTSGLRAPGGGGLASDGGPAGSCALSGFDGPSNASGHWGAFLCEANEDWDAKPYWVA